MKYWGTEKLSNLPTVAQLVRHSTGTQTEVAYPNSMLLIENLLNNHHGEDGRWQYALWREGKQAKAHTEWGNTCLDMLVMEDLSKKISGYLKEEKERATWRLGITRPGRWIHQYKIPKVGAGWKTLKNCKEASAAVGKNS